MLINCPQAAAATAAWIWLEHREPLWGAPDKPYLAWRFSSDLRLATRAGGLSEVFIRSGPMWHPNRWFYVALNGVAEGARAGDGRFLQEYRAELEPHVELAGFEVGGGEIVVQNRQRLESRWRNGEHDMRYRTRFAVQWQPGSSPVSLYIWEELIVVLTAAQLAQNRASVGVAYHLDSARRVELGYLLRSFLDGSGPTAEHILLLSFAVDGAKLVPRKN